MDMTDKDVMDGISKLRPQGLYDICFRKAGVGLRFYEAGRARDEFLKMPHTWDDKFDVTKHFQLGLVVYKYYPTPADAVAGETGRLDPKYKELLTEKVDALKAELDTLSSRLQTLQTPIRPEEDPL